MGTFLKIGLWALVIPFILRAFSVPRAFEILTPRKRPQSGRRDSVHRAIRYAEFWVTVRKRLIGTSCYQRTALLYRCMREQGLPVRIVIGLRLVARRRPARPLLGHSWLVLRGKPFLEERRDLSEFTATYIYP